MDAHTASVVGGAHGEHVCMADFLLGGPLSSAVLVGKHVGYFKFLVIWNALKLITADEKSIDRAAEEVERGAVIFSEADVVLLRDPLNEPLARLRNPLGEPLRGELGSSRNFSGDVLISGHAYNPMVNIGLMVFFSSDDSRFAAESFLTVFSDLSQRGANPFDQVVFDAQLGNAWTNAEWRKHDSSVPVSPGYIHSMLTFGRRVTWAMLPPSQYVEFSGSPLCWPLRSTACWGGKVSEAVTAHFTCLPTRDKLRNIVQLYETGACHFCEKCWGPNIEMQEY